MSKQDRERVKSRIPVEADEINVVREGKERWIDISDLRSDDEIITKGDGITPVTSKKRGRPKKKPIEARGKTKETEKVMERRNDFIVHDPLYQAIKEDPESDKSFRESLKSLAEIAASLKFERKEAERNDEEPGKLGTLLNRQKDVVKTIVEVGLKRQALNKNNDLDLDSNQFKFVFEKILVLFLGCMRSAGIEDEMAQVTLTNLEERLDEGWKEEVKAQIDKLRV